MLTNTDELFADNFNQLKTF